MAKTKNVITGCGLRIFLFEKPCFFFSLGVTLALLLPTILLWFQAQKTFVSHLGFASPFVVDFNSILWDKVNPSKITHLCIIEVSPFFTNVAFVWQCPTRKISIRRQSQGLSYVQQTSLGDPLLMAYLHWPKTHVRFWGRAFRKLYL